MIRLALIAFSLTPILWANEAVLYDLDYRSSELPPNTPLPVERGPYPGRPTCSELPFGSATIVADPSEPTEKVILMEAEPSGSVSYSQLKFVLFEGGAYIFNNHRIEARFQLSDPSGFTGTDDIRLFTDGGVFASLDFNADGSVAAHVQVENPSTFGQSVITETHSLGTFDPNESVHLILETRDEEKSATITLNGEAFTFDNLTTKNLAIRNGKLSPGPLWVRFSLNDSNQDSPLILRSFKISGSYFAGPQFVSAETPQPTLEKMIVRVPVSVDPSKTWLPEYSFNSTNWIPFGAPMSGESLNNKHAEFGATVADSIFVRFTEVID
ncbi:hypothetical protein AAFN60_06630 [Roseibacillus persicicus]|uniref:hypothetical protein n=1 Tax=Roseibacillus persicicus TaxID=454148 RepID=UPI00398A8ACC